MKGLVWAILVVIVIFVGAIYINPIVQQRAIHRYERDHPEVMIAIDKGGTYIDKGAWKVGKKITLRNQSQFTTYSAIQLEFVFTNRKGEEVGREIQRVGGPIWPKTELVYEAPQQLSNLFKNEYTITITGALGEMLDLPPGVDTTTQVQPATN